MPATQTSAVDNGWLVRGITFGIRVFLVFVVAFAQAVVIIAGDNYNDNLLNQFFPIVTQTNATPSGWAEGSSETRQARTTSTPNDQESPSSSQSYYVVFIGRDVGYTTSRYVISCPIYRFLIISFQAPSRRLWLMVFPIIIRKGLTRSTMQFKRMR